MAFTYPTGNDLANKIACCGVVDTTGANFVLIGMAAKMRAAIAEWEKRTGFRPYVARRDAQGQLVAETRAYDPPASGRDLELRAGLVRLDAVSVYDSPFVVGQDVFPRPTRALSEGRPFTSLHFLGRVAGRLPESIAVTGVWGHSSECEDDVREAVLDWACHLCVPELALQISRGLYQWRQGDEQERYGGSGDAGPLAAENALWERNFRETAARKTRVTL